MSIDSIITFIGLIFAALAIMPRSQWYIYKMRIRKRDWIILGIYSAIVLYLLLFPIFQKLGWYYGLSLHKYGIYPSNLIFIITLVYFSTLFIKFKRKILPKENIDDFGKLVDNLLQEQKYNDLIKIIDEYFDQLKTFGYGKESLSDPEYKINYLKYMSNEKVDGDENDVESRKIIQRIILNERFIEYIVENRSYIFLKFLDFQLVYDDVVHLIFTKLLSDNKSILYYELRYFGKPFSGNYDDSNELACYLLKDLENSKRLQIWIPFGDYALYELKQPAEVINNTYRLSFDDNYTWKSGVFVVIKFINILNCRAIYLNDRDDIFIDYYEYILRELLDKCVAKNNEDVNCAIPETNIEYYIFEIVRRSAEWILTINKIKYEIPILDANVSCLSREDNNLFIRSMYIFSRCLKEAIDSDNFSIGLKTGLFYKILQVYIQLSKIKKGEPYLRIMEFAILCKIDFPLFPFKYFENLVYIIDEYFLVSNNMISQEIVIQDLFGKIKKEYKSLLRK